MEKVTTRTAIIFLDENDILHMEMLPDILLDHEDAVDNAIVIRNLTKDRKVLKLIDARENWSLDKKARDFIRTVDAKQTLARAVVKSNAISSTALNLFTQLNSPGIPVKFFTDYEKAYEWLMGMKGS